MIADLVFLFAPLYIISLFPSLHRLYFILYPSPLSTLSRPFSTYTPVLLRLLSLRFDSQRFDHLQVAHADSFASLPSQPSLHPTARKAFKMSINALTLLALLPFLASLQLIAASPLSDRSQHEQRQTQAPSAAQPLGFQSVSDSMGISAQMVSGETAWRSWANVRCSLATRTRFTSWTSRRTTRSR